MDNMPLNISVQRTIIKILVMLILHPLHTLKLFTLTGSVNECAINKTLLQIILSVRLFVPLTTGNSVCSGVIPDYNNK